MSRFEGPSKWSAFILSLFLSLFVSVRPQRNPSFFPTHRYPSRAQSDNHSANENLNLLVNMLDNSDKLALLIFFIRFSFLVIVFFDYFVIMFTMVQVYCKNLAKVKKEAFVLIMIEPLTPCLSALGPPSPIPCSTLSGNTRERDKTEGKTGKMHIQMEKALPTATCREIPLCPGRTDFFPSFFER